MAAQAPNTGGGGQVVLIPNINPQNIAFKSTVSLFTQDSISLVNISEGYVVAGPTSPGVTPLVLPGSKVAIPLVAGASSTGSPFIKIHFPTSTNGLNKLYVTYCVANPFMADGFYDYTTGVPTAYMTALRGWINTNPITGLQYSNTTPLLRTKTLTFSDYGANTNKPANSVTFYITFQGTFQAILPPPTDVQFVGGGQVKFGT